MKTTGDPRIDESRAGTIVGSDEAGFGSWAGPLVVCAVATPRGWVDLRVKDSKSLSAKKREALYEEFWKADGFPMAVEVVPASVIDEKGVWRALTEAHEKVIEDTFFRLSEEPLVIVDGNVPTTRGICLPKADTLVPAVSLASIIAKVTHDRVMLEVAKKYPEYNFSSNMGYGGCKKHRAALDTLGPCPEHRQSYDPVKRAVREKSAESEWSILDDC